MFGEQLQNFLSKNFHHFFPNTDSFYKTNVTLTLRHWLTAWINGKLKDFLVFCFFSGPHRHRGIKKSNEAAYSSQLCSTDHKHTHKLIWHMMCLTHRLHTHLQSSWMTHSVTITHIEAHTAHTALLRLYLDTLNTRALSRNHNMSSCCRLTLQRGS